MGLIRFFKDIFTKQKFDFGDPDFNLYKYHPQLKVFLAMNGIFFNNKESKLRFILPVICVCSSTVGFCFEINNLFHGINIEDYAVATESFCFCIILSSIPTVILSILYNRQKVYDFLNEMNEHLIYILTLEQKYKNLFLEGQLLIWKLCLCWISFSYTVSSSFVTTCIAKLIYQTLFTTDDDNRPLPFPIYISFDDAYRSPNYEMFLSTEVIVVYAFNVSFPVFVYILFHILLHCINLMEMIFLDFDDLFDGLDETVTKLSKYDHRRIEVQLILNRRFKRIVDWHNSVFKLVDLASSVFGLPLAYQVTVSAAAICLMAYQIVDHLEQGKIHFLFLMLSAAAYVQLWIPCYLGSLLMNQGFKVGEAGWRCGWQKTPLGKLVRSDITILISRAQQPLSIKFPGLPQMELNTFSSIMSTSYSYFNIIRQYK